MFTRAGFNPRHRVICRAWITLRGRSWCRPARLVRFIPSGEYAWVGAQGISWPHNVTVLTAIRVHNPIPWSERQCPWPRPALSPTEKAREARAERATARFFLRIGQAGRASKHYDEFSGYLFPLPLILDAEGTLAADARHLVTDVERP